MCNLKEIPSKLQSQRENKRTPDQKFLPFHEQSFYLFLLIFPQLINSGFVLHVITSGSAERVLLRLPLLPPFCLFLSSDWGESLTAHFYPKSLIFKKRKNNMYKVSQNNCQIFLDSLLFSLFLLFSSLIEQKNHKVHPNCFFFFFFAFIAKAESSITAISDQSDFLSCPLPC